MEFSLSPPDTPVVDGALLARDREPRSVVVYARRWVAKATLINRARELYPTDL